MTNFKLRDIEWSDLLHFSTWLLPFFMGLFFIWANGQISVLTCTRLAKARVNCRLEHQFLDIVTIHSRTLTNVSGVEIGERCADDCAYWLELVADEGSVRLNPYKTLSQAGALAGQQELETLLTFSAQPIFEYRSEVVWSFFLVGVILVLVTGVLIGRGITT